MTISYSLSTKGQAAATSAAITTNTLTVATGAFITIAISYAENGASTAWTITNTGTAITWTKQIETNVAANNKIVVWSGTAGATPPTTVTVTTTAGNDMSGSKWIAAMVHSGANTTTPMPAGNMFSGAGGTDVTQAITPTSVGSCLWMVAGDFSATNSFSAGTNCTIGTVYAETAQQTCVAVFPTTQPRTDAATFTIGEIDTAGKIAWAAWEVQAQPAGSGGTTPVRLTFGIF